MGEWRIRRATPQDIDILAEMRLRMFASIAETSGGRDVGDEELRELASQFIRFASERMETGRYRSWMAECAGEAIGAVGLIVETRPPTPRNRDGRVGYLLNVYVEPEWRRRGLGRELVITALETLAEEGVGAVSLHASDAGRRLYVGMGFEASSEMRLFGPAARRL